MKRILFVDDDEDIRGIFQTVLMTTDNDFTLAADGQEALEKFAKGSFDLVITDMDMPKMSGMDLIREIREQDENVTIRAISACPIDCIDTYSPETVKELNFKLYLKPLTFDVIVEVIA